MILIFSTKIYDHYKKLKEKNMKKMVTKNSLQTSPFVDDYN